MAFTNTSERFLEPALEEANMHFKLLAAAFDSLWDVPVHGPIQRQSNYSLVFSSVVIDFDHIKLIGVIHFSKNLIKFGIEKNLSFLRWVSFVLWNAATARTHDNEWYFLASTRPAPHWQCVSSRLVSDFPA